MSSENEFLRKIAIDMTERFGFCPMVVTADRSYIMPIQDAIKKAKDAEPIVKETIERLQKRNRP